MALPTNADVVVVHGYWIDEVSGRGVRQDNNRPTTVTFEPVPLSTQSQDKTPNLRDNSAETFVKTRTRVAVVDLETGYFAQVVVSSNDPDLDAYGGRRVTFLGEDPFVVEVPYNALLTTVSAAMAEKTGLVPDSEVRAIWLLNASLVTTPPPTPPVNYLTSVQTLSTLASGIEVHDGDLDSHPDIRQEMADNEAADQAALLAHTSNTSNPHAVTKAQVGLGSADNTPDSAKPVSAAQQTALNLKTDKSANLSDLANATTARSNLGLGNVNNTADTAKPVSIAQQTALDLKLAKASNLSDIASSTTARTNLGAAASSHTHPASDLTASGTQSAATVLAGDNTWKLVKGVTTNGNTDATLTVGTSEPIQVFSTALTAVRTVTLSTTGAADGDTFRITRTAAATGASALNVGTGPLKALAVSTWCDVAYNGTAWVLTAAGSL